MRRSLRYPLFGCSGGFKIIQTRKQTTPGSFCDTPLTCFLKGRPNMGGSRTKHPSRTPPESCSEPLQSLFGQRPAKIECGHKAMNLTGTHPQNAWWTNPQVHDAEGSQLKLIPLSKMQAAADLCCKEVVSLMLVEKHTSPWQNSKLWFWKLR